MTPREAAGRPGKAASDSRLLPRLIYEWLCMYEILVTGPLCTSECAGRFSANLCKRVLDVTADVIVEATRNADMLTINASEDFQ